MIQTEFVRPWEKNFIKLNLDVYEDSRVGENISRAIGDAILQGDLRENASYQYAKDLQGIVAAKSGSLFERLENMIVPEFDASRINVVQLGSTIFLESLTGQLSYLTLTGAGDYVKSYVVSKPYKVKANGETKTVVDEVSGSDVYMNVNSPLGRKYLNAVVGQEIVRPIQDGSRILGFDVFTIVAIDHDTDALKLLMKEKKVPTKFWKQIEKERKELSSGYKDLVEKRVQAMVDMIKST